MITISSSQASRLVSKSLSGITRAARLLHLRNSHPIQLNALIAANLVIDDCVPRILVDIRSRQWVKRARVVINLVGPYLRLRTPLVQSVILLMPQSFEIIFRGRVSSACVRHGRHHVAGLTRICAVSSSPTTSLNHVMYQSPHFSCRARGSQHEGLAVEK
jgi:hypothetical protein